MLIFNKSWISEVIPQGWKKANILPIYKYLQLERVDYYRPVSLKVTPGKIIMDTELKEIKANQCVRGKQILSNWFSF